MEVGRDGSEKCQSKKKIETENIDKKKEREEEMIERENR